MQFPRIHDPTVSWCKCVVSSLLADTVSSRYQVWLDAAPFKVRAILVKCNFFLVWLVNNILQLLQTYKRNIEIYLHIVPIGLALASAITNLVLKNYNSAGWHCWIATLPSNCTSSYELSNGEVTDCIRGDNASLYQWGFFYVPLWLVINFCLYAMVRELLICEAVILMFVSNEWLLDLIHLCPF